MRRAEFHTFNLDVVSPGNLYEPSASWVRKLTVNGSHSGGFVDREFATLLNRVYRGCLQPVKQKLSDGGRLRFARHGD